MYEILTVCTGNICRSPLAELLIRAGVDDRCGTISSAGTHGLDTAPMTEEAQRIALDHGIPASVAEAHRSSPLTPLRLRTPTLVLAMAREHRRAVVELAPLRLRSTFTVREFARLAAATPENEILTAAETHTAPSDRLAAAVAAIARRRGTVPPPADPSDDDVVDPYRRSERTYERSAAQLIPAVGEVLRVLQLIDTAN